MLYVNWLLCAQIASLPIQKLAQFLCHRFNSQLVLVWCNITYYYNRKPVHLPKKSSLLHYRQVLGGG